MDDLGGWTIAPGAIELAPAFVAQRVLAIWQFTFRFRDATIWTLNEDKSNRCVTSDTSRAELRAVAGPPVRECFLDFGV